MKVSTKNSLTGRVFDMIGVNHYFNKYEDVKFDNKASVISPVEAKVDHIGKIDNEGFLISKNNKKVKLTNLIGKYSKEFVNGSYINFYLSPKNKHFWVTPSDGKFIYTQKNEGKSFFPIFIGLENILGIETFSKAIKRNASIGSILKTKDLMIAMIAVGSLNVNRIHMDHGEDINYSKGVPCGYFSLGSSMILCFQNDQDLLIKKNDLVKMGSTLK